MGFQEAIKSFFTRYVDFVGRSSRSEYWWVFLASIILNNVVISSITLHIHETLGSLLSIIVLLGTIVPGIALAVRRLHDLDKSGWWILIFFIPLIGAIVLIVFFVTGGTKGVNRFGPDPLGSDVAVFD